MVQTGPKHVSLTERIRNVVAIALTWAVSIGLAGCGPGDSSGQQSDAVKTAHESGPRDLAGNPVDPFRGNTNKAIVFIFVANDCPISNRYAPEVRRLYERFHPNGIGFWIVHPNSDESAEAVRKHSEEFQYPMQAILDPGHVLVHRARVHVTPEAAVFLPDGRLVYHGRIDDRYVELGRDRPDPTKQDLQDVLDAVVKGDAIQETSTRAVGCYISEEP